MSFFVVVHFRATHMFRRLLYHCSQSHCRLFLNLWARIADFNRRYRSFFFSLGFNTFPISEFYIVVAVTAFLYSGECDLYYGYRKAFQEFNL